MRQRHVHHQPGDRVDGRGTRARLARSADAAYEPGGSRGSLARAQVYQVRATDSADRDAHHRVPGSAGQQLPHADQAAGHAAAPRIGPAAAARSAPARSPLPPLSGRPTASGWRTCRRSSRPSARPRRRTATRRAWSRRACRRRCRRTRWRSDRVRTGSPRCRTAPPRTAARRDSASTACLVAW